ncbi:MAG: glycosyltransferase family 1 protein [Bryobacteraceae bacterium]
MSVALDATYSIGRNLSGVGVYSRKLLFGLAQAHPEESFYFHYRPNKFLRSLRDHLPANAHRRLLHSAPRADIFHALNQRVDYKGPRTVTTFHDLFVMTGEYSSPEFRERFTAQAREAAERSDRIIAVSQFTAGQVETLLGVEPSRIDVVPHGVDTPPPSRQRREKVVLFVGAIQKRKNVARLVQAFESMPRGWTLILAGAADGYGAAAELEAVSASSRRDDIQVAGYVTREELEILYARAAIFAFPSLDEGFGMPVLEAMARGVAVVTSNCSAMPEVAGDAALLVDPQDKEDIADALMRLAVEDELRATLVERGRVHVAQFTWDRAVRETWEVYDGLRR